MKKQLLTLLLMCLPLLGFAQDEWISYGDGTHGNYLNYVGNDYDIANYYSSADIQEIGFTSITSVEVYGIAQGNPAGVYSTTAMIIQGGEVIASKAYTHVANGWATVAFDTPVSIDNSKDLYVAIRYETGNSSWAYTSCDATLNYPGKGNLYRVITGGMPEEWKEPSFPGMGDWNIRIKVEYPVNEEEIFVTYGDGTHGNYLNYVSNDYDIANYYSSADIQEIGFTSITSVEVYGIAQGNPGGVYSTTAMIIQGGEVIASKAYTHVANGWATVAFDTPVSIDNSKDLYVAIRYETGNSSWAYTSCDATLNYPGKGNLYRVITGGMPEEWKEPSFPGMGDWNIRVGVMVLKTEVLYNVTFTNLNQFSMGITPCSDAIISLGTKVNEAGNYTFSVPAGEYRYIISKEGFTSLTGTITVTDADVTKNMQYEYLMSGASQSHAINFDIKDEEGNPLADAQVTFNNKVWAKGVSSGSYEPGIYSYSISCFGYETYEGTLIVIGNETVVVEMIKQPTYKVTFDVEKLDPVFGNEPITDAVISVGLIVNEAGNYVFDLPPGKHPYIVTPVAPLPQKSGYIEVIDDDIDFHVGITPGQNTKPGAQIWIVNEKGDQLVSIAAITFNGVVYPKNTSFIEIEAGIYDYTIECEGYYPYSGTFIVVEGAGMTTIVMEKIPTYDVTFIASTFVMVDGSPQILPITDATISLGYEQNEQGDYTFDVQAGTYPYIVKHDSYKTVTGTVTVPGGSPVFISFTTGEPDTFTLEFDVINNSGEAVTDAMVVLNGVGYAQGIYTFELEAGIYEYTVSRPGYTTYTGKLILTADESVEVDLGEPTLYNVSFAIVDEEGVAIEEATVTFNGEILSSYSTTVLPGTYSYSIGKEGYIDETGTVSVVDQDVEEPVVLYMIKFTVTAIINPENAGTVTGTGQYPSGEWATLTASANTGYKFVNWTMGGTVIGSEVDVRFPVMSDFEITANFELMKYNVTAIINPENSGTVTGTGEYQHGEWATLTAVPTEGYRFINWTMSGMEVGNQIDVRFPVETDIEVTANFELIQYTVTFVVRDQNNDPLEGATVELGGITLDGYSGRVVPGTYSYTVLKAGYDQAGGSVTVGNSDETIYVNLYESEYTVAFNVKDENGNAINDAVITFDGETLDGYSVNVLAGTYAYSVAKTGYGTVSGSVTVVDEDETVPVTLVQTKYTVTFVIKDENGSAVTDATIAFDGQTLSSASVDVIAGTYAYSVSKDGYKTATGNITVTNKNETVNITLEPSGYAVTFVVEDNKGNAIDGATIVFDGETLASYSTTVLPGTYTYSVSKEDYTTVSGTITVTGNVTVRVELSPSVGISDVASSVIKLYPNPFVNQITIDDPSNIYDYITISDISGSVKLSKPLNGEKNILTDNLSQGTYLITLSNKSGDQKTCKMLKK